MTEPTKLPVDPVRRSFEQPTQHDDLNRLSIAIALFAEMDADEASRTLRYLQDRFGVAVRRGRPRKWR